MWAGLWVACGDRYTSDMGVGERKRERLRDVKRCESERRREREEDVMRFVEMSDKGVQPRDQRAEG